MNECNIHHIKHKWRRTETIYPNTFIRDDDWSLLDATGDRIAQLFNSGWEEANNAHL